MASTSERDGHIDVPSAAARSPTTPGGAASTTSGAAVPAQPRQERSPTPASSGAVADPEIADALAAVDESPDADLSGVPADLRDTLDRIDVGYYGADAAEMTSLELNKVDGVRATFDVLDVADPFALVMGDGESDLRMMERLTEHDAGIAAAPDHASQGVLDHVRGTDEPVFGAGDSAEMLRTVYALNVLAQLDD